MTNGCGSMLVPERASHQDQNDQPEQRGGFEMHQNDFTDSVFKAIDAAWFATTVKLDDFNSRGLKNGELHSELSRHWMRQLGASLHALARQTNPDAQLSRRGQPSEFLFDLVIHDSKTGFEYAGRRLWAVESEFAELNSNVLRDFAKLLWADVENRLFVCSKAAGLTVIEDVLSQIEISRGTLLLCRLPHPRSWLAGTDRSFKLSVLEDHKWVDVEPAST